MRIRAKIQKSDDNKTLIITEIPFGTTTTKIIETIMRAVQILEFGDVKFSELSKLKMSAFYNCKKLRSVEILSGLTIIGDSSWSNGAFESCVELERVVLPATLTTIGRNTFKGCSAIEECDIPQSVTYIYSAAFANCQNYSTVLNLPNLTSVDVDAFYSTKITGIQSLGKITAIGNNQWGNMTFDACSHLRYAILPETLTTIGRFPFRNCSSLEAVCFRGETPPTLVATSAFSGSTCLFYVPDNSVTAYQEASVWSSFASRIKGISQLATDNPTLYAKIEEYL